MEDAFFEGEYPAESRSEEIEKILSYIRQGNSTQIISIPGAGRSTLLGLLAYNKRVRNYHLKEQAENYHFVMVEFAEIKNKPPLEALKLILLDTIGSLEDRPLEDAYERAKHIMQESLSFQDELVLFQGLKKVLDILTHEKQLHVVFLFDQFDTYIPQLTSDFFLQLKILRNRARYKLSIVFSLHKPLEYLLDPLLLSDFAEFVEGKNVYLPLLDKPSITFRINYIATVLRKTLDKTMHEKIFTMTSGHAKLTRLCVETALQENFKTPSTNYEQDFLSKKSIQKPCEDIWQSLTPAEQTHFLKHLFPNVLDDEHTQYLKNVGLMTETSTALPLFAAYVDTKREAETQEQALIRYNSKTKIITKGDTEISDKLTATEFRLLAFFLDNQEQIVERQHIIENVWKENKSLAGVSEQALDQLIFRLRQKIEDDPNHPTHLITVKGRGFKFTP